MWVAICIEIMQVGVSDAIMQVVFSTVHSTHMTISIVIMEVAVSIVAMYVTVSSSNFIFPSLTNIYFL